MTWNLKSINENGLPGLAFCLSVVLSVFGIWGAGVSRAQGADAEPAASGGPPPAPVETGEVTRVRLAPRSPFIGTVVSPRDARLGMEMQGRLDFLVEVGERLKEGEPVARLNEKVYRLEVAAAEAELRGLESLLAFQGRELERMRQLAEADNAARKLLDQVKTEQEQVQSRLQAAQVRLDLARDRLSKTTLYAPFAGVVAEHFHSVGALVKEHEDLLRLVALEGLEVSARIPAAVSDYLREGMRLSVLGLGARRAVERSGRLRAVVPLGDASRLYELRLLLEEKTPWKVGDAVRVLVPRGAPRQVLMVPRDALVVRSQGMLVYKLDGRGSVVAVPVQVGEVQGDRLEVRGEVAVGEQVVTRGNERLRPGLPVRVRGGGEAGVRGSRGDAGAP